MSTSEKRLSLVVDPTKAEEGAKKVKVALDSVSKKADDLQKKLKNVADLMNGASTDKLATSVKAANKQLQDSVSATDNLTKKNKEAITTTQKMINELGNLRERNSSNNQQLQQAIVLQQQKRTTDAQAVRQMELVTDAGKEEWKQREQLRIQNKAWQKEFTKAEEERVGVVKRSTVAQRTAEEITRKQARAEATLKAAQDGTLQSMMEKEKATKQATESIRQAINAMSDEEKKVAALEKANEKLERTYYAEEARLEALTTEMGRKSVATQEQRRITEELIRSTERLTLMQSEQGRQLVQNRVKAEQLARAYREEITGATKKATNSVDGLRSAFSALSTALSGVAVYFSGMGLARVADDYTNVTNRLLAVSDATTDVTQKTRDMLEMSIENRSTLDSTMDVYSKMIRANERLGKSQEDVVKITNAVSKAVAMSGASTAGAEGALLQFSQAMANDFTASAQELNSIIDQTLPLANYMAQGLRQITGDSTITTSSLKRLGTEGKLSAELMFEALMSVLPDIEEAFGRTNSTIDTSLKNLKDSFTLVIGEMDDLYEVSETITEGFKEFNKTLPDLKSEMAGLTASLVTLLGAAGAGGLYGLSTLLGPIGWSITGIAGVVSILAGKFVSAKVATDTYLKELDDLIIGNNNAEEATKKFNDELERGNILKQEEIYSETKTNLDIISEKLRTNTKELEALKRVSADPQMAARFGVDTEGLNTAIKLVEELTKKRDDLLEKTFTSMFASESNVYNSLTDSLTAFQLVLSEIPSDLDPLIEAQDTMQTTFKKIDKGLKDVEAEAKYLKSLGKVEEANNIISKATEKALRGKQQARENYLDVLIKIDEEESKTTPEQKRNEDIAKNILLLQEQVGSLNKGTEAYQDFLDKQEAASQLGFDSAILVPDNLKDKLKEVLTLIQQRNDELKNNALEDASKLNIEALNSEIKALDSGKEAYERYLLVKQATQALGGISATDSSDDIKQITDRANILADILDKLNNRRKVYNTNKPIEELQAEIKARKEDLEARSTSEEAYNELLKHRVALQAIGANAEDLTNDKIKERYEQVRKLLKEQEYYNKVAEDTTDPFSNMADSLERASDIFGDFASNMSDVTSVFGDLAKNSKQYYKDLETWKDDDEKISQIESKHLENQVDNYGDLLGASKNFFDEGSKGYRALEAAEMAFRVTELAMSAKATVAAMVEGQAKATTAVANQGNGDPYTAFGRIAAMAALMAGLGFAVSGSSGGADISADRQASQGTGTILGDSSAKSESILNATEYSADSLEDLVGINSGMLSELKNLNNAISGASNIISRDISFSSDGLGLGLSKEAESLVGVYDTLAKPVETINNSSYAVVGDIFSGLARSLFSSVASGLFGKSKVVDQGVQILGGTLQDILTEITARSFQTVKKKSWFSSSTSENYNDVSDAVESQFDLVFQSLFNTVENAMLGLGYEFSDFQSRLESFQVDAFKISLKGLSPDEQMDELNAVFSKTFDQLSGYVAPILQEFQDAGEGMGETLSRVSTNFQVFNEGIRQLDLQKLNGTTENILRTSEAFTEYFGDASGVASAFTGFVDTFATDERKFELLSESLTTALGEQDKALLDNRDSVYDYIKVIQQSGDNEVERVAKILSLTDSLDEYFDLLEDVNSVQESYKDLQLELMEAQGKSDLVERVRLEDELANATDNTTKMYIKAIRAANQLVKANDLVDSLDVWSGSITEATQNFSRANQSLISLGLSGMTYLGALKDLEEYSSDGLIGLADSLGISFDKLSEHIANLKTASDTVTNDPSESVVDNARNRVSSLNSTISSVSNEFFGGVIPTMEDITNKIMMLSTEMHASTPDYDSLLSDYSNVVSYIENVSGTQIENISDLNSAYFDALSDFYGVSVNNIIDASILEDETIKEINAYSNQKRGRNLLTNELEEWFGSLTSGLYSKEDVKGWIDNSEEAAIYESFNAIKGILNSASGIDNNAEIDKLRNLQSSLSNLPAAQQALQNAIDSLAEANKDTAETVDLLADALSRRYDLETQLLELQGDTEALRNRELDKLREIYGWQDNRLVSLQEEIWLLEDFHNVVGTARAALKLDDISVDDAVNALGVFGNTAKSVVESIAQLSQEDLDNYFNDTGKSADYLSENLKVLIESISDTSNAALDAAKEQADKAYSALQRAVNAEKELLKGNYESQSETISNSIDSVSESIGNLESASDSLKNALRTIKDETDNSLRSQIIGSQSILAGMVASGGVSNQEDLENAISILSQDSRGVFGSRSDYIKSQAKSLDSLRSLDELTDDQLSIERLTLNNLEDQLSLLEASYSKDVEALDDTLSLYKEQIDILNGIDVSVLSVAEAVNNLQVAIGSLSSASGASQSLNGGVQAPTISNAELAHNIKQSQGGGSISIDNLASGLANSGVGFASDYISGSISQGDFLKSIADEGYAEGIRRGYQPDGSHANGLDNVPFDNYKANLHQGEMVLTAPVAQTVRDMASNGMSFGDNEQVVSLLREVISSINNHSYNVNKKLVPIERSAKVIEKWDNTGTPKNRAY